MSARSEAALEASRQGWVMRTFEPFRGVNGRPLEAGMEMKLGEETHKIGGGWS